MKSIFILAIKKKEKMTSIIIISGTDRPNSNSIRVARFVKKKYDQLQVNAELFDLRDYPFHEIIDGSYDSKKPKVREINQKLMNADGLVFIVPEYNGSFPGVLKLMLDYMPFPDALVHKPIAYIGEASGAFGGLRAVEQLQLVMNYRNAFSYPERVFIQRISKNFNDEDGPTDPFTAKLLNEQCSGFVKWIATFQHELVE